MKTYNSVDAAIKKAREGNNILIKGAFDEKITSLGFDVYDAVEDKTKTVYIASFIKDEDDFKRVTHHLNEGKQVIAITSNDNSFTDGWLHVFDVVLEAN